ncbi:MAG: outer membrane beta-barrel protein [Bacteroidota bacterium]
MTYPRMPRVSLHVFSSVFALFLFTQTAHSQIQFGVIGGANFASLNEIQANGSLVSFDNATAFHAGAFLDIGLGPLSIRPAAYYLNAGALFKGASFLSEDAFDVTYVTIPVDINFSIGVGGFKPYVFAGPEFRLLNATDAPLALEEDLQSFTMGASAGLGVAISLPFSGLTFYPHIRYSFGLTDFTSRTYEVQGVSIDTGGDARVNVWMLSLGVGF